MQSEAVSPSAFRRQAQVLKALAHPSRLLMIHTLLEGERCVCELRDLTGQDVSTTSRHLSVLRNAGLLAENKRGLFVYYRITCPCMKSFLRCVNKRICETEECL